MRQPFATALILAAFSAVCDAQTPQHSWDNLRRLRPGEDIEVVDMQMKSHRGRFAAYAQDSIVLSQAPGEVRIARPEVASVKRRARSHRGRNALMGLAIGAAGGLAIGAIRGKTYHEAGETSVFIAVWTPIGAGIGAAAGAALPTGREVTVYRAGAVARR